MPGNQIKKETYQDKFQDLDNRYSVLEGSSGKKSISSGIPDKLKYLDEWLLKKGANDAHEKWFVAELTSQNDIFKKCLWCIVEDKLEDASINNDYVKSIQNRILNVEKIKKRLNRNMARRIFTLDTHVLQWGKLGRAARKAKMLVEVSGRNNNSEPAVADDTQKNVANPNEIAVPNSIDAQRGASASSKVSAEAPVNSNSTNTEKSNILTEKLKNINNQESPLINDEEKQINEKEDGNSNRLNNKEEDADTETHHSIKNRHAGELGGGLDEEIDTKEKKRDNNPPKRASSVDEGFRINVDKSVKNILSVKNELVNNNIAPDALQLIISTETDNIKQRLDDLKIGRDDWDENISRLETAVLRTGQLWDAVKNGHDVGSNSRFWESSKDYGFEGETGLQYASSGIAIMDSLLTVFLAIYGIKKIKDNVSDEVLNPLAKVRGIVEFVMDAPVAVSSGESVIATLYNFFKNNYEFELKAWEGIETVFSWAIAGASAAKTVYSLVKLGEHGYQHKRAYKAKDKLDGIITGDTEDIKKKKMASSIADLTITQKKHKMILDGLNSAANGLTSSAAFLTVSTVGIGLGLIFGIAAGVLHVISWIAGISSRKKRRNHMIDTYFKFDEILGGQEKNDEEFKEKLRLYLEAKLMIPGHERMAKYILQKYAEFLHNAITDNNAKDNNTSGKIKDACLEILKAYSVPIKTDGLGNITTTKEMILAKLSI